MNAIERRYLAIVGAIDRDRSIRKGFAIRQARDGRDARETFLKERSRGSRKRKIDDPDGPGDSG
jgi:hypothetical protein